ncbi:excalibur calcium-binding domain-containing protein [Pseudoclavibacter sp. 8L]|uniref:excalibur calcium-binding domain-containing protein n=1 Tax=Pseudoclavibacter sp. 8L TaxID=2653162 RepID=UPI0012F236F7|nr:excalibur calcium-binding domain-containing protein [Pseudoclavibacter sp. 8L]VXC28942.1 conserved hypothetical protein [Pseudoclavibacter sp. 8L]
MFGVLSGCASASEPVAETAPTVSVITTATLPTERVSVTVTTTPEVVVPVEEVGVPDPAPVYAEDPGYGPHLDRDSDDIGCEQTARHLASNKQPFKC